MAKFITFEGCEGVGKSTQLRLLQNYLNERNVKYFFTREPGGSSVSEQIRKIILDGKNTTMTDE
ncbi:MAG: dTMP kinase, partial [Clostridiales bacterium]|nr:dTMP kinase [Clostridiales bacterium]